MINIAKLKGFAYEEIPGIGIFICGDSSEVMMNIDEKSIDHVITDPPYNLGAYSTGDISFSWRSDINNSIADWDQGQFHPEILLDPFKRIVKETGNIFAFTSYNLIGKWHDIFDSHYDTFQFIAWHKTNPVPKFRKAGFLNSVELIVALWNKGHVWNFINQKEMHNFIESPICGGKERLKEPKHPTQKPVKILKHLIGICSNENEIILDPFSGVGSTAIAAFDLGRRFVCIEKEMEFHEAAVKRFRKHFAETAQATLVI